MIADYHHIPKILDLIAAIGPDSLREVHDGPPVFTPLFHTFLDDVPRVKNFDLVLVALGASDDRQTALDHVGKLLARHRGVLVVAAKPAWEKADIAGLGPAMFVNDPTGVIAFLGKPADIKRARHNLLRYRVRRQSSVTPTLADLFSTMRRVRAKGGKRKAR